MDCLVVLLLNGLQPHRGALAGTGIDGQVGKQVSSRGLVPVHHVEGNDDGITGPQPGRLPFFLLVARAAGYH